MSNIPKHMTGMYLTGYGGYEHLSLCHDIPVPESTQKQ